MKTSTPTQPMRTTGPNPLISRLKVPNIAILLLLLALPAAVQGQFNYTTNDGTITITKYTGPSGYAVIPGMINGLPVTRIGEAAFYLSKLGTVTIPASVTSIGEYAFGLCWFLTRVHFKGNAPDVVWNTFGYDGPHDLTFYYLPGTTGWGEMLAGRPALLWNPHALMNDGNFGVQAGQFGFTITGTIDQPGVNRPLLIVVEACTNLTNPIWIPVGTNFLSDGSCRFTDPQWTNHPTRLYRFRFP